MTSLNNLPRLTGRVWKNRGTMTLVYIFFSSSLRGLGWRWEAARIGGFVDDAGFFDGAADFRERDRACGLFDEKQIWSFLEMYHLLR